MKRLYIYVCVAVLSMAATMISCSKNGSGDIIVDPDDVESKPQWTVDVNRTDGVPQWVIADSTRSLVSTMSVIGAVPENSESPTADCVAFFSGEQCIGIATPKEQYGGAWMFMAKVYEPYDKARDITMAYHQKATGLTWYWMDALSFATDAVVGSVEKPLRLDISKAQTYPLARPVQIMLSESMRSALRASDELAVFNAQGQCRCVFSIADILKSSHGAAVGVIQLREQMVDLCVRYYSSEQQRIVSSAFFSVTPGTDVLTISDINL